MPFEAEKSYVCRVADCYPTTSSQKGTRGFAMKLTHETAGDIYHTLWLASNEQKTKFVELMQKAFGIKPEVLKSSSFWEDPMTLVGGKDVEIKTKQDSYNGRDRVIVAFVNAVNSKRLASADDFASFFGGGDEQPCLFPETEANPFEK